MTISEHINQKWLDWLLELGMTDLDSLMYNHFADNIDCECSVCVAMDNTRKEEDN